MAEKTVAGDAIPITTLQRIELDKKFDELVRQTKQPGGYPFDFEKLIRHLQNGVEGKFELIVVDQSDLHKEQLKKFYMEVFGIDLSTDSFFMEKKLTIQNSMQSFMYVVGGISRNMLREAEKKIFNASWSYKDDIDASVQTEPQRPKAGYWMAHEGSMEPDKAHRNKSYNQYSADGGTYMTIKEYMLCRLFAYWLKKEIWDKKGVTLTSSLDTDGFVMFGDRYGSKFKLDWCNRDYRNSIYGPRSAVIF